MPHKVSKWRFYTMLEILPPTIMNSTWFLVWEPTDHEWVWWLPRYKMYTCKLKKYLSRWPKTILEFREIIKNMFEIDSLMWLEKDVKLK